MRPASEIGDLAEILVNYQLSVAGLAVFAPSASHLPYDLLADLNRGRFLRIQVKGSVAPKLQNGEPTQTYAFNVRQSQRGLYTPENLDWFAFVALDIEQIIYAPASEILSKPNGQVGFSAERFNNEHAASKQALLDDAMRGREGLAFCPGCSRLTQCE